MLTLGITKNNSCFLSLGSMKNFLEACISYNERGSLFLITEPIFLKKENIC